MLLDIKAWKEPHINIVVRANFDEYTYIPNPVGKYVFGRGMRGTDIFIGGLIKHKLPVNIDIFSPDGEFCAASAGNHTYIYKTADGTLHNVLPMAFSSLARLSADGNLLFVTDHFEHPNVVAPPHRVHRIEFYESTWCTLAHGEVSCFDLSERSVPRWTVQEPDGRDLQVTDKYVIILSTDISNMKCTVCDIKTGAIRRVMRAAHFSHPLVSNQWILSKDPYGFNVMMDIETCQQQKLSTQPGDMHGFLVNPARHSLCCLSDNRNALVEYSVG